MLIRSIALCCWLLLAPALALAGQALLSVDQSLVGQSNVFKTVGPQVSDGSYELQPHLRFFDPDEKFLYDVEYAPAFEAFFKTDGFNGIDHFLRSRLQYQPTRIDTVHLRANVANYRAIRATTTDGVGGIPDVIPGTQGDITRVFIDGGYERQITRATMASATAGFQHYSYTTPSNVDSTGVNGELMLLHEPISNVSIGGSVFGSYRDYQPSEFQAGSENAVFAANLVVRSQITPTIYFDFKGGPAGLFVREAAPGPALTERFYGEETDAGTVAAVFAPGACGQFKGQPRIDECPPGQANSLSGRMDEKVIVDYDDGSRPPPVSDEEVTFFIGAELRKEDSWGYASLDFRRTEDASAGSGFTTIRNSLTASSLYAYDENWTLGSRFNWNRRNATGIVHDPVLRAGDSGIPFDGFPFFNYAQADALIPNDRLSQSEIDQIWLDVIATRSITDHLSIELMFRYQWQQAAANLDFPERSFDNLLGSVMFRYEFTPFDYLP
jgi:hypothetical protein